jgi:hypothetical protein
MLRLSSYLVRASSPGGGREKEIERLRGKTMTSTVCIWSHILEEFILHSCSRCIQFSLERIMDPDLDQFIYMH